MFNLYSLDSIFDFGKYRECTLRMVLELNAYYIEWCILNVDFFVVMPDVIDEMKKKEDAYFGLTREAKEALARKLGRIEQMKYYPNESVNVVLLPRWNAKQQINEIIG